MRPRRHDFASFLAEACTLLASSLDYETTLRAAAQIPVPLLADWCAVDVQAPHGPLGGGQLWPELPAGLLDGWACDPDRRAALRGLDARSAMIVPLRTAERSLGVMMLVAGSARRRFDRDDLECARDYAARCAMAIENALMYGIAVGA